MIDNHKIYFAFPISLTNEQVNEWVDYQDIALISDASFDKGSVCMELIYEIDNTPEINQELEKSCTEYFKDLLC